MSLPEPIPAPPQDGAARARRGAFVPAVVVPTYHNAGTLPGVLEALDVLGLTIVVVDDGCRDASPRILAEWVEDARGADCATDRCSERSAPTADGALGGRSRVVGATGGRRVVTHPVNRGKGAALRSGFGAAAELGATHAVTIDSDGQHDASDIPALLAAASEHPRGIIIGARPGVMPGRPARCLLGLRLANALVEYECGRRLSDTQSGLRVYPLEFAAGAPCASERFSYETEMLIRAAWEQRPIVERPIRCRYFPPEQRTSHWRPVVDTIRDVKLHGRLLVEAMKRG